MAGVVIVFQMIFYSTFLLPIYVVVGGSVFFLALRLLRAINAEDLGLVEKFLGPRFRIFIEGIEKVLRVEGVKSY